MDTIIVINGKKYRPYTQDELKNMLGKAYKSKSEDIFKIVTLVVFVFKDLLVDGMRPEKLLAEYTWLDGTPCGVLVEGGEE